MAYLRDTLGEKMAEFCRRCGAEIATANLMDIDPGVDYNWCEPDFRERI
jgi:hypothetical protein